MQKVSPLSAALLLGFTLGLRAAEHPSRITVLAGGQDRRDCVVWFTLPAGAGEIQQLADEQGNRIALQTDPDGHACFMEKELKRGSTRTYRLVAADSKANAGEGVQVVSQGTQVKCSIASDRAVLLLRAFATGRLGDLAGQAVYVALPVYRR